MPRILDMLGSNWLALVYLGVAAGFLIRVLLARSLERRPWSSLVTLVAGGLGLGGLFVPTARLDLLGYPFTASTLLVFLAILGLTAALAVLLVARAWSYWLAVGIAFILLLGLGGWTVRPQANGLTEAAKSLRGLEFVRPEWLGLLILVPLVFWISRKSLSGLGPVRRRVAITARALGVAALALALAEPRLRQNSDTLTVLFVVDRSFSIPQELEVDKPATEARDLRWERVREFIDRSVATRPPSKRDDKAGYILFGKRPKLIPPDSVERLLIDERAVGPLDGNYTDIAAALKLALASFPEGTSKRIVLISDGNENLGNAEEQANIAKQNGVQIDGLALAPGFKNENEVLVQSVEAPSVSAQGQRLPVRVLIRNATPDREVDGRLEVVKASTGLSKGIEIEDGPQVLDKGPPAKVRLRRGLNVFRFQDRLDAPDRPANNREGVELDVEDAFAYRATFIPTESRATDGSGDVVAGLPGDRAANNRASAAIVTRGERRVLFLDDSQPGSKDSQHAHLLGVLNRAGIKVSRMPVDDLPAEKTILGGLLSRFDCVVLGNVAAERFTLDQMEILRSNVYDQGCGLIMIGGPDSFGAGGYQGTPVEAALPVDCEIKALKAAGKGGLVLIMHASEMADGNKWQKDIAKLAVQRLGPADMVGVVQYGFGGGASGVVWQVPFQSVGETDSNTRNRILAAIDRMTPGDMPDFDPFLKAAADTLSDEQHQLSVKHCILISDGDPNYSGPGRTAVKKMADNGITCSTVGVATHGGAEKSRLKVIAEGTRDANGKPGNFYDVTNPNQLPAIYMKESRRVSQSFLYVQPFVPTIVGQAGASDVLPPGLPNPLPSLHGFVRTTMKQNILAGMSLEGPTPYPDQQFPVLASWRYGLGKAVAFTSDARTQPGAPQQWWDRDWVGSEIYQKFWEQLINWSMREPERGKMSLVAEYRDGRIRITADVRDEKDNPVAGLTLRGAATPPNAPAQGENAPQVEFKPKGGGLYEAEFPAEDAGSYFLNVQAMEAERDARGNVALNPDGTPRMNTFDAARAGVTVPYSPEFSDLESNTPLMERLAAITGGQFYLEDDPAKLLQQANLFRDAPNTLKSLLPFWYWLVFAAAVLLLLDVATRRIALETQEVRLFARRFWANLRHQTVAEDDGEGLGRLLQRKAAIGAEIDKTKAARKFDPTQTSTTEPAPAGADEYATKSERPTDLPRSPQRSEDKPEVEDADDPLTRLRKAKERAKHQRNKRDEQE